MRFATLALFAFVALLAGAAPLAAAPAEPAEIVLSDGRQAESINQKAVYFVDDKDEIGVADVVAGEHAWVRPASDNLTFDLPSRTVWLHLRLRNPEAKELRANIELNPVFLEWITAYDAQGRTLDQTGSKVAPHRIEAFPTLQFDVAPGVHDVYVSIKSRGNSVAMMLRSEAEQDAKDALDLVVASSLIGGLLALMVYHLFMFATHRNRNYALNSLFIFTTAFFTASFTSYHRQLLPAQVLGFATDFWWSALASQATMLALYLFTADLLGILPGNSPRKRLARALLVLPAVHALSILLVFATDSPLVLIPIRLSSALSMIILPAVAASIFAKDRVNTIAILYVVSWLPFAGGVVAVVLWLSGVAGHHDILPWSVPIGALAQSLLLSFAASQRLRRRDGVIAAFVSDLVVRELDQGLDPRNYGPRNVEKCVVFLDMHDYTRFSEAHSPLDCHRILNQYFHVINATTYRHDGIVDKIIGDAMMLVFDAPARCLAAIVELRRELSTLNRTRVEANLMPIRFGVGISYGTMLSANFGSRQKLDRTVVGDNVNVASRLEAITRPFAVDVLCTKEFVDQLPGYEYCRPAGYVLLKGRAKKSLVYELFEHNLPEVVAWKMATRLLLPPIIELEQAGKYDEALAALRAMIARCPPHSYRHNQIMDPTLHVMVAAIEEKMRTLGLAVPDSLKKVA